MKMGKTSQIELTNMVMVRNPQTGEVLMEERVKYWCGICFPGGHINEGESFYDSAVREVYEETGIKVKNLKPCGTINWASESEKHRYVVLLYKTEDFEPGELKSTDEGRVFWIHPEDIDENKFPPNFGTYYKQFMSNEYKELYYDTDIIPDTHNCTPEYR